MLTATVDADTPDDGGIAMRPASPKTIWKDIDKSPLHQIPAVADTAAPIPRRATGTAAGSVHAIAGTETTRVDIARLALVTACWKMAMPASRAARRLT
jgi:hypothetical protein